MLNPYQPTDHPDDRPWFSGFPRWVKRAAVVVAVCIAVLVIVDALWIVAVDTNTPSGFQLKTVVGEEVDEFLQELFQ